MSWTGTVSVAACRRYPSCSQYLLEVLQMNEFFRCVALSAAVECSLRHLRNWCFSSTICRRREVVDSAGDVFANVLSAVKCELILKLWTVNSHMSYHWCMALSVWLVWVVFITSVGFLQCTKLLAATTVTKPNRSCETLISRTEPEPWSWSNQTEPNPNCNNDRTKQNPNLHCWVRFPSLLYMHQKCLVARARPQMHFWCI